MVVMDTDTVTDTVMDMDMVTTLERDLLSHTTDTQPFMPDTHMLFPLDLSPLLLDQQVLLDIQEQLPPMLPEAHKDSANRFF